MACAAAMVLAAWVLSLPPLVFAETFNFDNGLAPRPHMAQMHFQFYVYTSASAPDNRLGAATSTIKLMLRPEEEPMPSAKLSEYRSVKVSLVPEQVVAAGFNTSSLCSGADGSSPLALGLGSAKDAVVTHTVTGDPLEPQVDTLLLTGVYALVATNCGDLGGFRLSGTVSVLNPHGYLPANDYHKRSLFGLFAFVYFASFLAWSVLCARWQGDLVFIQKDFLMISLVGGAECATLFYAYDALNKTGDRSEACFLAGSVLSLLKVGWLFRGALLASKAFGDIPLGSDLKAQMALTLYAVAVLNFWSVSRLRSSYAVDETTVIASAIPVVVSGIALFAWAFRSMATGWQSLMERKAAKQAALLPRSSLVLAAAALGAAAAFAAQLAEPTLAADASTWGTHVMCPDSLAQFVFLAVLWASMLVWRPSEATGGNSGRNKEPSEV